jgi:hypothetical protein
MNSNPVFIIIFLMAGMLLTSVVSIVPAAYAGGDKDNGGSNKQKVEDESAGAIADCDKNEVERADFKCIADAAREHTPSNTEPEKSTVNICKEVINEPGANGEPSDFSFRFEEGNNPTPREFEAEEQCTAVTIDPGDFLVSEGVDIGFTERLGAFEVSGDCSLGIGGFFRFFTGQIGEGETQTCTVTNTIETPTTTG